MSEKLTCSTAGSPGGMRVWMQRAVLGTVAALVIVVYGYTVHSGPLESSNLSAAESYYNSLVDGFRAGQLNLRKEVPPGFAQLADPYDPAAHMWYPLLDTSYYKGKLYLYFGVTPAVVLFWPAIALTGQYLLHKDAVLIFCVIGFLTSAGLLSALWRRYFSEVSVGVVAAGILALGLATGLPLILAEADVWEVPISCGYAFAMLALAAIWMALHQSAQRGWWLAAASLAYGLAVGARPSWLFGAVVLLVPVAYAWRQHRPIRALLLAATGPILLIGLGLLLYNYLRFDNSFEFGCHYQLSGTRQNTASLFRLRYLWFNFRLFFLAPVHWSRRFPFVQGITVPPFPGGQVRVKDPFGAVINIPLVWLALAVPLFYRGRTVTARSPLGWFLVAVAVLFGISALTLSLFFAAMARYEVEFLSTLVLLAVMGILILERGLAGQPFPQRFLRWGWSLLLGFSVAFNLFTSFTRGAEARYFSGSYLDQRGQVRSAIECYRQALRLQPDYAAAHNNWGGRLDGTGPAPGSNLAFRSGIASPAGLCRGAQQLGGRPDATGPAPRSNLALQSGVALQAGLYRGAL